MWVARILLSISKMDNLMGNLWSGVTICNLDIVYYFSLTCLYFVLIGVNMWNLNIPYIEEPVPISSNYQLAVK